MFEPRFVNSKMRLLTPVLCEQTSVYEKKMKRSQDFQMFIFQLYMKLKSREKEEKH